MPSSVAPASSRRSVSWSQTGNRRASDPGRGSGTFRGNHGTDFRSRYTQRNRLAPRDVRKTRNPVDRCRPHHLSAARRRRATYSKLDRCQMVRGRVRRTSTTSLSASVISSSVTLASITLAPLTIVNAQRRARPRRCRRRAGQTCRHRRVSVPCCPQRSACEQNPADSVRPGRRSG
jgi:hypothetical protein